VKIEGRNAVAEAIRAGTTVDRLVVQKNQKDPAAQRLIEAARQRGIKILFFDKEALDRESTQKRHQGFIAEVTDFKYAELDDIFALADKTGRPPFLFLLDGVEDPHNLGSIIRVAECAGAHGIVLPRHRSVSVSETVVKVSAGAAAHVLIAKETNLNDTIDALKKRNVWVYAADMAGEPLFSANLKGACAFVIGGEGGGVKRLTKEKCDGSLAIPMRGSLNSLNAGVAAGVVAFEYVRQNT
jgi:23S rRNA (guanosine2251-2'-O)-methyltransferase